MPTKTKAKRPAKAEPTTPADKVKAWLQALRRGKVEFRKADQLVEELLLEVGPGEPIDIGRGGKWRIVDKFATTNTAFRSVSVNRYALEQVN